MWESMTKQFHLINQLRGVFTLTYLPTFSCYMYLLLVCLLSTVYDFSTLLQFPLAFQCVHKTIMQNQMPNNKNNSDSNNNKKTIT